MPSVVVSHKNCVDGMISAAIAAISLEDPLIIMCQYTENWDKLVQEIIDRKTPAFGPEKYKQSQKRKPHDLYVLDFSIPYEQGKNLLKDFRTIIFIDHHESSKEYEEDWKKEKNVEWVWGGVEDCGATLVRKYFNTPEYHEIARLAHRFDTWQFTDEQVEETFAFDAGVRTLWDKLVKWDKPDAKKLKEFASQLLNIPEILKSGMPSVEIGRRASQQVTPILSNILKSDGQFMKVAIVPRISAATTSIFGYWVMRDLDTPLILYSVTGDRVNVSARCKKTRDCV